MSTPQRIQRRRTKGWRMPENTVYVGRGTRYGNPWRENDLLQLRDTHGTKQHIRLIPEDLVMFYRLSIDSLHRADSPNIKALPMAHEIREELAGKNLACWCPLDQPCHADVLLEIANKEV